MAANIYVTAWRPDELDELDDLVAELGLTSRIELQRLCTRFVIDEASVKALKAFKEKGKQWTPAKKK